MSEFYQGKFDKKPEEPDFDGPIIGQSVSEESIDVEPAEQPAQPVTPKKEKVSWQKALFRDARDVLYILAIFMLVYVLFFRAVVVVGDSMYDTLHDGDRLLLISNIVYTEPKQGDIIVASKDSFRNGECIIKRVIATEGQTVDIDFNYGIVYVDGVALDEDYIYSPTLTFEGIQFPITVAEGCVFVMGDNRMDSKDSRNPEIGQIDEREILGKVIFLLLPGKDGSGKLDFSRIGVIG